MLLLTADVKVSNEFTCQICRTHNITGAGTSCIKCGNTKNEVSQNPVKVPIFQMAYCKSCKSKLYSNEYMDVSQFYCPKCTDVSLVNENNTKDEFLTNTDNNNIELLLSESGAPKYLVLNKGEVVAAIYYNSNFDLTYFKSSSFREAFINRVSEVGLSSSLVEFSADLFSLNALSKESIRSLSENMLVAEFIPRYSQCIALAVEATLKNIYPEIANEFKASWYDYLQAQNINDPQIVTEQVFANTSSSIFSAILAKALELYTKEDSFLSELASIVASSTIVKVENIESNTNFKHKLVDANFPITRNEIKADVVEDLRMRLKLSKK